MKENSEKYINSINESILNEKLDESKSDILNEDNYLEDHVLTKKERRINAECKKLCDEAFRFIKLDQIEEASLKIEEAYKINENFPDIYLVKLYITFNVKSYNELRSIANEEIISSPFFKAAYKLGDTILKDKLNYIVEEVEYKKVKLNLEEADVEQLLKHLRVQKHKNVDYSYTISLILTALYKAFRFINEDYINENLLKENFIPILKRSETSFQYYMDLLFHFDDISDIKDIVSSCVKEHKLTLNYLLIVLRGLIENTVDKDLLIQIKEYLEFTYFNHEADELIELINPKIKKNIEISKKGIVIGVTCACLTISCIGISVGVAINTRDAPIVINGITYAKNSSNGYTITSFNEDLLDGVLTFENNIDGLPVNEIREDLFRGSNIRYIYNFPDAIRIIPDGCFSDCNNLQVVEISSSSLLNTIGSEAFKNCVSLSTLYIPQFVHTIGSDAFLNTPNLINLIKDTILDFNEEDLGLTLRYLNIEDDDGESIYQTSYYSWDSLSLPIPTRYNFDFSGYQINDNPEDFLSYDSSLNYIKINCQGYYSLSLSPIYLTALTFIDSSGGFIVTYKADEARTKYTISSVSQNEDYIAGSSCVLYSIINGVRVEELDPYAFQNNKSITSIVNLSTFIDEIPNNAFRNCVSLERLTFSELNESELYRIGENAFYNCESLKSFSLPSTVTEIGDNAFRNTVNLTRFNSNYDFGSGDLAALEYERIGFSARNYRVNIIDGSDVTTLVGVFYNPQEVFRINFPIKENHRVIARELNIDTYISTSDDTQNYLNFNINGLTELFFNVNYERYYDSNYSLNLVGENLNSQMIVSGSIETQVILDSRTIFNGEEIIDDTSEVIYEFVENGVTSNVTCRIEGNVLYFTRNYSSSLGVDGSINFRCYRKGLYSEERLIESRSGYIQVKFY